MLKEYRNSNSSPPSLPAPASPGTSAGGPGRRAHRVIASLNREQVDVLDKIGKDALFSSGLKLSRTEILSAMVNVLKRLKLSGEGIHSAEQFEQRVVELVMKARR